MDAKAIIEKLTTSNKVKDYSLLIVFFLVFAVFVWFAIRPNLITAFSLQKELEELRERDGHYEEVIASIVEFQTKIETNRQNFFLLDEAVPPKPTVASIIQDIIQAAEESGIPISRLELEEVNVISKQEPQPTAQENTEEEEQEREESIEEGSSSLTKYEPEKTLKNYLLVMETNTSYQATLSFVDSLVQQKRLKLLQEVDFSGIGTSQATDSAQFRVQLQIEGLYL